MNIKNEVLSITPDIAKSLLETNISNRKLNKMHVENLSKSMECGSWRFTGESIKVAETGG